MDETNKKVETSNNPQDFIKNLVEETLSVENGEIKGKDTLATAINRIMEINQSKTTIGVLESVKAASFRSLDLNWINGIIGSEKAKMERKSELIVESAKEEQKDPTLIAESKKEDEECEECCKDCCDKDGKRTCDKDCKCECHEEHKDDMVKESQQMIMEPITPTTIFVSDTSAEQDKALFDLYNSIIVEHHLHTKKEKIGYVMDRMTNEGDNGPVTIEVKKMAEDLGYMGESDEDFLNNLSDREVEMLYRTVEELEGRA